jgi:hypothetical protein
VKGNQPKPAYFEGNCKGCGVYGHKWNDCWYNKDNGHAGKPHAASLTEAAVEPPVSILKALTLDDAWCEDSQEPDWQEDGEWQEGYDETTQEDAPVLCGLMAGCVAAWSTASNRTEYALLDSGSAITACDASTHSAKSLVLSQAMRRILSQLKAAA